MPISNWMIGLAKVQIVLSLYAAVLGERWRLLASIKRPDRCSLQINYLGKRLLERRLQLKWKPVKVASLVGVTVKTVIDAENGVRVPHHSKLARYAKVLRLDLQELEDLAEQSKKPTVFRRTGS